MFEELFKFIYKMIRIIFGGMGKKEIVRVFPKETRRGFPDVDVRIIANLDNIVDALNPSDSNFVVHRFLEDDVLKIVGRITGVSSSRINAVMRYNPLSEKDYRLNKT